MSKPRMRATTRVANITQRQADKLVRDYLKRLTAVNVQDSLFDPYKREARSSK